MIYRDHENLPKMISEIRKEIGELKTRQRLGSNQIFLKISKSHNISDITITTSGIGQVDQPPYWGAFTITATAKKEDTSLVADLINTPSYTYPDKDYQNAIVNVALPPHQGNQMKWVVFLFGDLKTRQISNKIAIVANADVDIQVVEGVVV